ncbi:uncharacterized protein LOC129584811 isoform X2 [Paramacrobiotus metropolitanus]|uniref:uncharacterized protein LOC129584811 isoform X2 n=1 Tax=Paramacrobiotus metropolitanus TaxID=2943436 RepID=UPI002445CB11|nr:uncharacterized protein LOC129584811 isoform X2 [Paramacrobiotus metropolitanus]
MFFTRGFQTLRKISQNAPQYARKSYGSEDDNQHKNDDNGAEKEFASLTVKIVQKWSFKTRSHRITGMAASHIIFYYQGHNIPPNTDNPMEVVFRLQLARFWAAGLFADDVPIPLGNRRLAVKVNHGREEEAHFAVEEMNRLYLPPYMYAALGAVMPAHIPGQGPQGGGVNQLLPWNFPPPPGGWQIPNFHLQGQPPAQPPAGPGGNNIPPAQHHDEPETVLDKLFGVLAPGHGCDPYKLRESLPLIVVVRNYVQTVQYRLLIDVHIDGKVRTDPTFPSGFMAFDLTGERLEVLKTKTKVSSVDISTSHPDAVPAEPKPVLEYELKRTPTASAEDKYREEEFKNKGNKFMKNGQVDEALQAYTEAVTLDPTNPILYCNRAAASSKKNQHDLAAKDCEVGIAFDGNFAKAYGRYGLALNGSGLLKEAKDVLDKAVSGDPEDQLYKNSLKLVENAINAAGGAHAGLSGGMPGAARGFPNIPGMPGMPGGMGGGGIFDMLQNQEFQQTMMQNPQVQQMVGQFSNMFMNQMAGAGGAPGGAAPPGMPPGMPDMAELLRGGMPGMGNMTPEQIAEQMRGIFGGQQPPDSQPGSQPKPEDKDKNDKGPGSGAGGNPSYFS